MGQFKFATEDEMVAAYDYFFVLKNAGGDAQAVFAATPYNSAKNDLLGLKIRMGAAKEPNNIHLSVIYYEMVTQLPEGIFMEVSGAPGGFRRPEHHRPARLTTPRFLVNRPETAQGPHSEDDRPDQ